MDEETQKKKKLADAQGKAYGAALDEMREEAVNASVEVDDYIITVACENAEGMYMYGSNGELEWMIPDPEDNQHAEIVVQDRKDKRFIPGLEVSCKLLEEHQAVVQELEIPFIWHPFLFHYGTNCSIPKEGEYTFKVTVQKPAFHRHDEVVGKRYLKDVTVTLGPIHLVPGRKEHGPE